LLYRPTISLSQYQPKHHHDCKLKEKVMDPTKFIEFLNYLSPLGVQWVAGWWRIGAMSSYGFKENCVPLVGLCCCSYYPMCCIARQLGDRQGVPHGNGYFHTMAFTKRILGRTHETWSRWVMNRGIDFPQFLYPTSGYKDWLSIDMRAVHR